MDSEALAMIIVMPTMLLVTGWAFKTLLMFFQQRRNVRYQFEIQSKLLDRFHDAPELLEYLKSDAGTKFLETAMIEPRSNPQGRILTSIQAGLVLSAVAVGFLVLRPMIPDAAQPFAMLGVIGLCLGVGFLASAWVATNLAKRWGLIHDLDLDPTGENV